ncbi:MAG TPA: competence/damage-inducible protein A, partial [Gemmataceae bacterium]
TELTTGRNLDTNTQWLSRRLAEIGIPVAFHTTVGDDFDDDLTAFRTAVGRAGLVIATGGLGPTQDDLTRDVLARLAGVELVEDPATLEHLRGFFARRGREMPERNRVQALFPRGSEPIPNPVGTAPGIWMPLGGSLVVCMPGVPSELFRMYEEQVKPRLVALGVGGGVLIERKLNVFGAGESMVEQKVMDLTRRGHVPEVGITASDATISLRILASAATEEEALRQIAPVEAVIRERLGDMVFGTGDEELQYAVAALLEQRRLTLATAESVTAGLVARRLAEVPGISAWLCGGVVAYQNRTKVELLGVPEALIEEHGAVSRPVVEAMAAGCRARLGTDLAVATVGFAGPGGGTEKDPVGSAYVALASAGGVVSAAARWPGTRTEVQSRVAKSALNLVRLHLLRG